MVIILKKTIVENKKNWDSQLKFSLWKNKVTTKRSTHNSHFELAYQIEVDFPIQLAKLIVCLIQVAEEEANSLTQRIN